MSNKSVLYLVIALVLTIFLQCLRDVAIEFIKSTEEPQQNFPSLFMTPFGPVMPSAPEMRGRSDIAGV